MFYIGCYECRDLPQIPCKERLDIMVAVLKHEKLHHFKRWNETKEEVLQCALSYQLAAFVEEGESIAKVEYQH